MVPLSLGLGLRLPALQSPPRSQGADPLPSVHPEALRTPWEKPVSVCAQSPNSLPSLNLGDPPPPQTLEGCCGPRTRPSYATLCATELSTTRVPVTVVVALCLLLCGDHSAACLPAGSCNLGPLCIFFFWSLFAICHLL